MSAIASRLLKLVKILCENFELELKEAFKFCEGLKVPKYQYEGKIIYPNMAKEFIAYLDTQGFFTNQKCFILSDNIKDKNRLLYLTAILNSKTNFWYFKQIGATLGASGYEMSKIFVEKLPVVETNKIDSKLLAEIEALAKEILEINNTCHSESYLQQAKESHTKPKRDVSASPQHDKINNCHSEVLQSKTEESLQNNRDVSLSTKAQHDKQDSDCHSEPAAAGEESLSKKSRASKRDVSGIRPQHDKIPDTSKLESEIDSLVYKLYNLTDEEIKIVESK